MQEQTPEWKRQWLTNPAELVSIRCSECSSEVAQVVRTSRGPTYVTWFGQTVDTTGVAMLKEVEGRRLPQRKVGVYGFVAEMESVAPPRCERHGSRVVLMRDLRSTVARSEKLRRVQVLLAPREAAAH